VKGDIVVVPFPFSDLSRAKRRPALVLATLDGDDLILCQVTSRAISDVHAIPVAAADFETGALKVDSNIRPNRIFTAERSIVAYRAGHLKATKTIEATAKVVEILQRG
jgi:mRNA interferase MazF